MNKNNIICIDREFGSGGRHIGKRVAEILGIPYYDKELIEIAAKSSGYSKQFFEDNDEQPTNSFLYSLSIGAYSFNNSLTGIAQMPITDKVFQIESDIIRETASKGSCVIVGRCAGNVLKDIDGVFTVFVHADLDYRVARVAEFENISKEKASDLVKKTDKKRAGYHNMYSDLRWGDAKAYDLCINGALGIDESAGLIVWAINNII